MKRFICSLFLILCTSCATQVASIKEDKDKLQSNARGYLLLGVETSLNLKELFIDGPENIKLSHADLKHGTNFILIDLEAGTYNIDKIKVHHYWRLLLKDEELWEFTITPKTINYVGHIELSTSDFFFEFNGELVNRSSEALEFLEDSYPNILANRTLSYGGPGEDDFFELVRKFKGE